VCRLSRKRLGKDCHSEDRRRQLRRTGNVVDRPTHDVTAATNLCALPEVADLFVGLIRPNLRAWGDLRCWPWGPGPPGGGALAAFPRAHGRPAGQHSSRWDRGRSTPDPVRKQPTVLRYLRWYRRHMPRIATSFVSVVMSGSCSLAALGHCPLIGMTSARTTVNAADLSGKRVALRSGQRDRRRHAAGGLRRETDAHWSLWVLDHGLPQLPTHTRSAQRWRWDQPGLGWVPTSRSTSTPKWSLSQTPSTGWSNARVAEVT
jgi:hypothetical protein